jgi:hypothetical protein
MSNDSGSYHVHMEDEPYCISFGYTRKEDRERRKEAARERAKSHSGALVGPFEFNYDTCAYRRMMEEELDQRRKEAAERVSKDETIPENERTAEPSYARMYRRRGLGSWHVHTDGYGWCRSFDNKRRAMQWIRDDAHRSKNPRIVGPLDHPAIACKYFHDNDPTYRAERKT